MSEQTQENKTTTAVAYTLDGRQVTLMELNEAKSQPGIKIVEEAPGVFKTLKRLNG